MILILGGTSDSLTIAEELVKEHSVMLSVATEAGYTSAAKLRSSCRIEVGRKNEEELKAFLEEKKIKVLVDATHPYAVIASENGKKAAEKVGIPYFRYSRPGAEALPKIQEEGLHPGDKNKKSSWEILWVEDYKAAAVYVEDKSGVIFSTLGSKNIRGFIDEISDKSRIIARILPDVNSMKDLIEAGLGYDQIIAMKGPFSTEMNYFMMKEKNTAFLLTKDSGKAGGYEEKISAAKLLGIKVVVIKRHKEAENTRVFTELQELLGEVRAVLK